MPPPATPVRRELTDDQLAEVLASIDATDVPVDALINALRITFDAILAVDGESWTDYNAEHRLDGSLYAIPDVQWTAICEALMSKSRVSSINSVNLGLDWMNIGPTSYTAVS